MVDLSDFIAHSPNVKRSDIPAERRRRLNDALEGLNSGLYGSDIGQVSGGGNDIPTAGLVSYWPLDDLEGGTAADYVGRNDGTVTGSVSTVTGKVDNAAAFGGNGAHVETNPLEIEDGLTVSAWVYPIEKTTDGAWTKNLGIVSQYPGRSQSQTWIFEINSDLSSVRFWDGSGNSDWLTDGTGVPETEWTHVAAVWKRGGQRKIYVDGEERASEPAALDKPMDVDGVPTRVGYTGDYSRYFKGRLDEVRVYDRDLTATEIGGLADEDNL